MTISEESLQEIQAFNFEKWINEVKRENPVDELQPGDVTIKMMVDQGYREERARKIMDEQVRLGIFTRHKVPNPTGGGHLVVFRPVKT